MYCASFSLIGQNSHDLGFVIGCLQGPSLQTEEGRDQIARKTARLSAMAEYRSAEKHNAPPGGVLCDAGYTQSSNARRAHIGAAAGVMGRTAQLLLDTHELVVFFHSLAARGGAGLEMAGIERHGEIRNETVHGLA